MGPPADTNATPGSPVGDWNGTLDVPGSPLDVGVSFTQDGDAVSGTLDIPTQGIADLPFTEVTQDGDRITFAITGVAGLPGDPTFTGRLDGDTIAGEFTQAGRSFPLTLSRGAVEPPDRPQEPQPPFPYGSEDVTFSGDVELAGTLTTPQGTGPFPAVLLVTGSGAQDRDETIFGHKLFLLFADTLTRAGYAVLRVDDRGVGGSGGVLGDAGFEDLSNDIVAGLAYLRARAEIDADAVGLLGHSEGGYLAPLVAQRPGVDVDFVMLMAGPAVSGEDILVEQNRLLLQAAGAPQEAIDAQVAYVHQLTELLRPGDFAAAEELTRARIVEQGGNQAQTDQASALANEITRAFVTYDPAPALSALRVPVLAVFGGRDLQVPAAQNEPAMRALLASNPDATVRTFPELNHLMQPASTGLPTEFATIETTIDPRVLEEFISWLEQRFPAG